jgi:hypothetical protein
MPSQGPCRWTASAGMTARRGSNASTAGSPANGRPRAGKASRLSSPSLAKASKGRWIGFRVAMRPGKRRVLPDTPEGRLDDLVETAKAHIRAKVEHPFRVI